MHAGPDTAPPDFPPAELAALRRQDAAAFTRLVDASQGVVLSLARAAGLHGADSDDAAAEAFLAVYRALPRFEGRSALTTWVYTIAARTITAWRAKAGRRRTAPFPDGVADAQSPSPADAAETSETHRRLWAAVADLEPRSGMAVELYYRRGLDVEAVAAVLGCPVGTVKTLLHRARQRLKSVLDERPAEAHP